MGQATFAELYYDAKKRTTCRERFLERLDRLVPWRQLEQRICAPLPDAGTGAPALPTLTDAAGAHRATGRQPQRPGDGGRAVRESHRAALRGAQALGRDPR